MNAENIPDVVITQPSCPTYLSNLEFLRAIPALNSISDGDDPAISSKSNGKSLGKGFWCVGDSMDIQSAPRLV